MTLHQPTYFSNSTEPNNTNNSAERWIKTPEKYKRIDNIPTRLYTLSKIDLGKLLSLSHTFIDTEIIFDKDKINIINELHKEMNVDHYNDDDVHAINVFRFISLYFRFISFFNFLKFFGHCNDCILFF